jgi:subtilisin family serine protease
MDNHKDVGVVKFLAFSLVLLLSACGGGGGGGSASLPATTVSLAASPIEVLITNTTTLTWSTTNATSCSASGAWSGTKTTSGSETVTIAEAGNNNFTLSCSGAGQSGSASLTVEGYRNVEGAVVDGYISGASVFIDKDNDWIADSSEYSGTSDDAGKFTIRYTSGDLVSSGGTDLDSQILLDEFLMIHKLTGYSDFKVITPVTSVAAFLTSPSAVNESIGINSSIDIATFDPVANKGDGGINDYLYEKGNQLTVLAYSLQNITNDLNITTETTQDYFKAIAEEIEKEYTETSVKVDIETEVFVSRALDNVITAKVLTMTDEAKANVSSALSGVMSIIEVKSSSDLISALANFTLATLQVDIKSIANGTASAETIGSYKADIINYIATDQSIDANSITPNVIVVSDSANTLEDTSVEISVLPNDTFVANAPFSLVANNGSNGTVTLTNDLVTYTPTADYNGTDSFSYTITQGDKTATAEVTLTIEPVNDEPTMDASSSVQVAENQIAVSTIAVSDVDTEDTLALTLEGTDADSFELSDQGVLTFKVAPDYETKSSYSITLSLTDGTVTVTKDVSVDINDVNEPPIFSSSSTFSAAENQTAIGSVSVSDPENATLNYSLSGADAGSLAISSTGVISFGSAPNYESRNTYAATVSVSDGVNTTAQDVSVDVTDVNDAPIAIGANYYMNLKPQPQTSGSITLAGSDEDGDTLTYTILSTGSYGAATLSGADVAYQTSTSTQSSESESFTFKVNDGTVDSSSATVSIDLRTDPLYQYQWHLNNTGQTNFATNGGTVGADLNVDTVIASGITGSGVTVAVLDSGLELAHEDLSDNVVNGSWDFANSDEDPTTSGNDGDHGTSVAGIIASQGWNKKGGRGVAPNASLIGYNYLESQSLSNQLKAWGSNPPVAVDVDIYNMSYGRGYGKDGNDDTNTTFSLPSFFSASYQDGLVSGVTNLRGGKGAVYITSSGNAFKTSATSNCGTDLACTETLIDAKNGTPYIIHVGALDADGVKTSYSTPGPGLWVSGFGGEYGYDAAYVSGFATGTDSSAIMTTDQSGCTNGYVGANSGRGYSYNAFDDDSGSNVENSDCSYHSRFNGTSSAAPMVSGVVALMLEANPDLTWRDVKHILATTADQVDVSRSYDYRALTQYEWETNSAGYKFHNWYGFGKVDAAEAVTTAASYTANSRGAFVSPGYKSSGTISATINDNGTGTTSSISITAPVGSNNYVEHVGVYVQFSHAVPKSVGLRLQSPDGTIVNIMQPMTNVGTNPSAVLFKIGVNSLYGESMEGTWTIEVHDYIVDSTSGTLTQWGISIYGN